MCQPDPALEKRTRRTWCRRLEQLEKDKSSWLALRIFPSSHTNPIFVLVDGEPINASRRSTEWMREVARRLWTVKSDGIRDSEKADARQVYENADETLRIISEQASDGN